MPEGATPSSLPTARATVPLGTGYMPNRAFWLVPCGTRAHTGTVRCASCALGVCHLACMRPYSHRFRWVPSGFMRCRTLHALALVRPRLRLWRFCLWRVRACGSVGGDAACGSACGACAPAAPPMAILPVARARLRLCPWRFRLWLRLMRMRACGSARGDAACGSACGACAPAAPSMAIPPVARARPRLCPWRFRLWLRLMRMRACGSARGGSACGSACGARAPAAPPAQRPWRPTLA